MSDHGELLGDHSLIYKGCRLFLRFGTCAADPFFGLHGS